MYYHIKYCFLVLVLSVVYELQCSEVSENDDVNNQRNILINRFQNALMNDSEQLFTLKKVFLLPRPIDGPYLNVKVTVEGRITGNEYLYSDFCSNHFPKNNSCTYVVLMVFNAGLTLPTLADVLQSQNIVITLQTLDPSFYSLTNALSRGYYSYNRYYTINLMVDNIELNDLYQVKYDVTDALYVTLSWVSCMPNA